MENNNKKKKKFPVWMFVVGGLVIGAIFITIRINSYMKNKKKDRIETAAVEPDIDNEEKRKGMGAAKGDLVGLFNPYDAVRDSAKQDSAVVVEEEPIEVKATTKKKVEKPAPKKQEPVVTTALSSTIEKENKPKAVKRYVAPKPKKDPNFRDVKFNFVIVKDDSQVNPQHNSAPSSSSDEATEDLTLYGAKIYGDHILKHNEPVTLRTTEDIKISRKDKLPSGSLLYGLCSIGRGRLEIKVSRALTPTGNYPVDVEVYDGDYVKGIFLAAKNIDVQAEDGMSDVVDEIGDNMPNQLIGSAMKATTKTVQKDLKKMKRATISVPDGYRVFVQVKEIKKSRG